jgi:D-aminopeptidase
VNGWRVGALVQANYGERERLTIDGVPVGRELSRDVVPSVWDAEEAVARAGAGSIIVVLATDAPLLPHQLDRLAQRAGLGIARVGGSGGHSSGDIFLAFSTANAGALRSYKSEEPSDPLSVTMLPDGSITDLFWAAIESTEEAICNALVAAETMVGRDGITAHALPHDALVDVMARYGRGPASS